LLSDKGVSHQHFGRLLLSRLSLVSGLAWQETRKDALLKFYLVSTMGSTTFTKSSRFPYPDHLLVDNEQAALVRIVVLMTSVTAGI
jgi:hypothetical protein